jgi:ribose-phosphate pyrophosphokinase
MKNYLKIMTGSSNPLLAQEICDDLDCSLGRLSIQRSANDNLKVRVDENVREDDVFVIQTSCSPVNDHFIELLLIIDALKYASARRITAVLPYYPYVRSDKKDDPRISIGPPSWRPM